MCVRARVQAAPAAGQSHAGRRRDRGARQRLQPQRLLLLHGECDRKRVLRRRNVLAWRLKLLPSASLQPIVMHLACVNMRMSMPEALAAATINAAYALGRCDTHGSLEVGKHGDLLVVNAPR